MEKADQVQEAEIIEEDASQLQTNIDAQKEAEERQRRASENAGRASKPVEKPKPFKRDHEKIKRNDPCPCGSGKKFKQCHGR